MQGAERKAALLVYLVTSSQWVDSDLGKGTTFSIYFPTLAKVPDLGSLTPASCDAPRGSETILVVEDEPQLRDAIAEYLGTLGYSVLCAGTATEALRIGAACTSTIAVLVADLVLPGAEGPELANALWSLHPNLKVIYISGYSDRSLKDLGVGSVLLKKPFLLAELATTLRARLERP